MERWMFEIIFEPDTGEPCIIERDGYRDLIVRAFEDIRMMFLDAGFAFITSPLEKVVFITDVAALKRIIARAFELPPEQVPDTFAGSPRERTLYMAIPSIVEPMLENLYPQIPWDGDHEYFECLKHEIFHMFHEKAAIELCGSADGMGPPWFFESLAVACSGQFSVLQKEPPLPEERIREIARRSQTTIVSYVEYGRIGYSLLKMKTLQELLVSGLSKGDVAESLFRPAEFE